MNVAETLLVFAGAPLAVVLLLAALIYLPAGRSRRPRYKPGQPWEHAPVWYEPHPEGGGGGEHAGGHGAAVHGDDTLAIGSSMYGEPTGGHQQEHGSSSGASARPAVPAGPLGGARGTW